MGIQLIIKEITKRPNELILSGDNYQLWGLIGGIVRLSIKLDKGSSADTQSSST